LSSGKQGLCRKCRNLTKEFLKIITSLCKNGSRLVRRWSWTVVEQRQQWFQRILMGGAEEWLFRVVLVWGGGLGLYAYYQSFITCILQLRRDINLDKVAETICWCSQHLENECSVFKSRDVQHNITPVMPYFISNILLCVKIYLLMIFIWIVLIKNVLGHLFKFSLDIWIFSLMRYHARLFPISYSIVCF
jgi:hypothetical protein